MEYNYLIDDLASKRKALCLNIPDLALMSGVSENTIRKMEKGEGCSKASRDAIRRGLRRMQRIIADNLESVTPETPAEVPVQVESGPRETTAERDLNGLTNAVMAAGFFDAAGADLEGFMGFLGETETNSETQVIDTARIEGRDVEKLNALVTLLDLDGPWVEVISVATSVGLPVSVNVEA